MSEPEHQQRAKDLARLWQGQVVPVDDEGATAAQRSRVIPAIGDAIGRAAVARRKERSRRRWLSGFALAAGVIATIGIGRYVIEHRESASALLEAGSSGVRAVSGVVTLVHESGPTVIQRAPIEVGDALSTAAEARAELRLTDLVLADVGGSSALSIVTPTNSAHRLRLERGRLHARVDDRPSRAPKLVIETPNVDVVVTGTMLQVEVTPGRTPMDFVTRVSVTKGRVVLRRGATDIAAITAGQSWSSGEAAYAAPEPARAELARAEAAQPREPRLSPSRSARAKRAGTLAEENALFQAAVDARNRGDDHSEVDRLGALLGKYSRSPLAGEARVERMRALQRTGQVSEAAREARRYLAEYPDGFAREEARRLVMQDGAAARADLPSD